MAGSKEDLNDLKKMKKEAEELRNKREKAAEEPQGSEEEQQAADDAVEDDPASDEEPAEEGRAQKLDHEIRGLAVQIDGVVKELESLARKQPSLALVSAFTAGYLAGKLFSRR